MSYARRTDGNSREIVDALRKCGAQVHDMQRAAKTIPGFPDLLVCFAGEMHLIEVKTLTGDYTDDQRSFHHKWTGPPIYTLRSIVDATTWINFMRGKAFKPKLK